MRRALAPILFEDHELSDTRKKRDPVLAAKPSKSAESKKQTHRTEKGLKVHSFETLIAELASRGRNTYRLKSDPSGLTVKQVPEPTALQTRAYELLGLYPVKGN
jgi:hypothetical protein